MSQAHCAKYPNCMKVGENATIPTCDVDGCPGATSRRDFSKFFLHVTPNPDDCKHDFKGWVEIDGGRGGTTVCTKCGLDAMTYSLRTGM